MLLATPKAVTQDENANEHKRQPATTGLFGLNNQVFQTHHLHLLPTSQTNARYMFTLNMLLFSVLSGVAEADVS